MSQLDVLPHAPSPPSHVPPPSSSLYPSFLYPSSFLPPSTFPSFPLSLFVPSIASRFPLCPPPLLPSLSFPYIFPLHRAHMLCVLHLCPLTPGAAGDRDRAPHARRTISRQRHWRAGHRREQTESHGLWGWGEGRGREGEVSLQMAQTQMRAYCLPTRPLYSHAAASCPLPLDPATRPLALRP